MNPSSHQPPSIRSTFRPVHLFLPLIIGLLLVGGCGKGSETVALDPNAKPTLIEFGSDKCLACQTMKPVIDGLREDYADQLEVIMVDVWQEPDLAEAHGIEMIPTQVFKDASGNEVFRHTGQLTRDEILDQWRTIGVNL